MACPRHPPGQSLALIKSLVQKLSGELVNLWTKLLTKARAGGQVGERPAGEQVLGPTQVPGDVVVPDYLPAHKVAGRAELVEARGARPLYLPPCSPGFNPIGLAFSKLKTWLRPVQARTGEALEAVIHAATEGVTARDAKNWFAHCDYHVH